MLVLNKIWFWSFRAVTNYLSPVVLALNTWL